MICTIKARSIRVNSAVISLAKDFYDDIRQMCIKCALACAQCAPSCRLMKKCNHHTSGSITRFFSHQDNLCASFLSLFLSLSLSRSFPLFYSVPRRINFCHGQLSAQYKPLPSDHLCNVFSCL